jgi:hypothetical protein
MSLRSRISDLVAAIRADVRAHDLFIFETREAFEDAKAGLPDGARVVLMGEYPDDVAGGMVVPDYIHMEEANRIPSTSGGSWTADRTGFVRWHTRANPSASMAPPIITVDGIVVERTDVYSASGGSGWAYFGVIPLAAGQTITISPQSTATSLGCYYIPPLYSVQKLPVIVNPGRSYSLVETATGETWLDGKKIYRRAYTGNIVAAAGVQVTAVLQANPGIDAIVDYGGWWQLGGLATGKIAVNVTRATDNPFFSVVSLGDDLNLVSTSYLARAGTTNNAYQIWVEYTKV